MTTTPYGSWKSPVTAAMIATSGIGVGQVALDGDDIYWTEMRPVEGGRYVVVRRTPDGTTSDVTPPAFNARTRVHEYGGGAYVVADGVVYFSNFADQRLYRQDAGGAPVPITPEGPWRYADGVVDRPRGAMFCVREDHSKSDIFAANTIVRINLAADGTDAGGGDAGVVIVEGNDFYAAPRLSPDGRRLAWITWNHPNMPWDGTELWVADVLADGSIANAARVAGGETESIFQPEWSPDGVLHFVSDRTGWWNLYRRTDSGDEALCPMEAEFGRPAWQFRMSAYAFVSAGRIVCSYMRDGVARLALLGDGELRPIELPYTSIGDVRASGDAGDDRAAGDRVVIVAGSAAESPHVVAIDLASGERDVLRTSSDVAVDAGYLSMPESVEFPTEGGLTAHGIYYAPKNTDYEAPPDELPPLIVKSHGGPTGSTTTTLNLEVQYWTSRGFAVLDVNYGGSTGYGRAYRERLKGQWGIVDVDDCVNGALYLAERGLADPERLIITGGSAGGYTTLCALTFRDYFAAGASYYGVADAEGLAKDTHKFESRYLDGLIGAYPAQVDVYKERSPIQHTERLSRPVIFFQGLEDQIVPPNQAEAMVASLRAKGVPFAYVPFEGEQHGFRRAENIQRSLEAELYFYGRVLGFEIADDVEPVVIEGLE
jgi:dipeptidyl aminopeptidase/acylaminoacyl peptidase